MFQDVAPLNPFFPEQREKRGEKVLYVTSPDIMSLSVIVLLVLKAPAAL